MTVKQMTVAGRICPASYSYSPSSFARSPDLTADVLYVIGGLYGNRFALAEIERMAECEDFRTQLVFNGDYHWFDADPDVFAHVDSTVAKHTALRGNVETEIAGDDDDNGCGCAYPESVPDADVERSNAILQRLRNVARVGGDSVRDRLAALPMHLVAEVGAARIGIVHGDAWALAGWRFAHDSLHSSDHAQRLSAVFELSAVDGFASTHTCLPALKTFDTPLGERFVVNNGAAGMPNFGRTCYGLITRLATVPVPRALTAARLYGADVAGVYVEALAVRFDTTSWDDEFDRLWPRGSPAHVSYKNRIVNGPQFTIDEALGRATVRACVAAAA
ncbi:MAG: metallophosphoesterase family protein [Burkholderiaceae bacterium]